MQAWQLQPQQRPPRALTRYRWPSCPSGRRQVGSTLEEEKHLVFQQSRKVAAKLERESGREFGFAHQWRPRPSLLAHKWLRFPPPQITA